MTIKEKQALTHERILAAATRVFSRNGFESSRLDQVALLAKIGKGTIYNYFKSKEDLFESVVHSIMQAIFQRIIERTGDIKDPLENLVRGITALFEYFEANPDACGVYLRSFHGQASSAKKRGIPTTIPHISLLEPKIQRGFAEGILKPCGATTEDIVLVFLGITGAFLYKWYSAPKTYDWRSKIPVIAEIIASGTANT
jgi:TetR/AcrR family fatty acid metabolism transcriptional regulator